MSESVEAENSKWTSVFDWAYVGVDHSLPGNGGQDCVDFIPLWQRVLESGLACVFSAFAIWYGYQRVTLPEKIPPIERSDRCGKRVLLVVMCMTFGIELGFKFATRQFIWICNPCHITSMIQIYLLAAPPSKTVTAMFRMHLHMLQGAPIAILFPVINTRLLPFETEVYFIQHTLMMIIPYYLFRIGGVYTAEKVSDMSWTFLSLGWLYFFHFVPLNYLAVLSHVNLNNMLCPAVSDPFYGRLYRVCGMGHQLVLIPLVGKFVAATGNYFKSTASLEIPEKLVFVSQPVTSSSANSVCATGVDSYTRKDHIENLQNGSHLENSALSKDKNGYLPNSGSGGGDIGESSSSNGHIKKN